MGLKETKKICIPQKAIYELIQSPRAWFGRYTKAMKGFRYKVKGDHTLFAKHLRKEGVTIHQVYVDDITGIGNNEKKKEELKQRLVQEFELKALGGLKYVLGIEIAYCNS